MDSQLERAQLALYALQLAERTTLARDRLKAAEEAAKGIYAAMQAAELELRKAAELARQARGTAARMVADELTGALIDPAYHVANWLEVLRDEARDEEATESQARERLRQIERGEA
jgi:hypothetical protein